MIEVSTLAMSKRAKKVNLFLIDKTQTERFLSQTFLKYKNIEICRLSYLEKHLLKIGFLSLKYKEKILSSDIIFIHNYRLLKYLSFFINIKPIILFFHTDKEKQFYGLEKITKVFTVNSYIKDIINNIYGNSKATCLPNSIDIKNKSYIFKKSNAKIVVGAMGRIVRKKGFKYLIEAVKNIKNIELKIAGDGPLLNSLKEQAKGYKNIKFLGWIENKNIFFKNIDIFCCPSIKEPFGLVILEAMLNSIPVISTKCKGPIDIIDNMKNGILVNVGNSVELESGIKLLQNNKFLRKNISKNAFDTLKKKYSIDVYRKKLFLEIDNIF